MNKELFVSSTPHETKVGLVEDDLLAEIYLERENEYTLAGSIYKGRVTRVLPGMQSAFVDIGLERDAFLYVSDFMDLEEHDEDLTDTIPADRGVQDLRPQPGRAEGTASPAEVQSGAETGTAQAGTTSGTGEEEEGEGPVPAGATESAMNEDAQGRDRGWRGRRRRRGGRRDGRERGEQRYSRPGTEGQPSRSQDFVRTQPSGPPAGYTPILLPGESISKYQRWAQPPQSSRTQEAAKTKPGGEPGAVAASFPEDEPFFAAAAAAGEPLHEQHGDVLADEEEQSEAATSVRWEQTYRQGEPAGAAAFGAAPGVAHDEDVTEEMVTPEHSERAEAAEIPAAGLAAAPGTMEEETIDEEEEEAEAAHYGEHAEEEGFEEFEEETTAAGDHTADSAVQAREAEGGTDAVQAAGGESVEAAGAQPGAEESEEDSEELELEEAQAEAEALLEAEARGNGTVDARAEVRAPSATAGYTQRAPRPAWERRGPRGRRGGRRFRRSEPQNVPKISDLLKEGQEILVQIAKEPIGKKGARITSHIALPGRFLVYMPTVNHTGVSRKIASEEERQRLKRIILSERENGHGGFIVRTAAQNAGEDELRADIRFLKGLWNEIRTRAESSKPPALIYHDLNVVERVLRDQVTSDFSVIWVDTEPEYERILRFFNRFQPGLVKRVKLYTKETPLFEQFGLAEEMNKALKSKVWLKSGGYIVINQTEALVAIDINTGKYVGKTQRLEDTIVKTNVDAIKEIVRQIRLRDLGGIIIIDFIDMDERRNRQRVMQALEEELRHDRAPSKTLQFNDFGLVAITRKRVKQSLERTIGAPCPYCQATGYVKSVTTVCNEIYVEMRKIAKHLEHEDVMLRVNPEAAKELKANNGRLLNELEELTKRTIIVKSDPALHQEQFDIN